MLNAVLELKNQVDERPARTVRIEDDLVVMAETVRRHRRQKMTDYLSPILRAKVEADYRAVIEQQFQFLQQKKKG
jgi:hypothetical protein